MLAGPVFTFETITAARRARYFIVRTIYCLVLLVALSVVYSAWWDSYNTMSIQRVAGFAAAFFQSFSSLQLLAVVLMGPAMAAGTIAQERERRTIEYLFASDLSNLEIVLGKVLSRLLMLLMLVMAGLPVLSLAMLLGGIAPTMLAVVFVLTVSTMLAVTCLSTAVSVWSPRARDAVMRVYLFLLALILLPYLLLLVQRAIPWWLSGVIDVIRAMGSAANPIELAMAVTRPSPQGLAGVWEITWRVVGGHLVFAVACLVLAVWGVRRVHLRSTGVPARGNRFSLRRLRPRVGGAAMMWKELFAERGASRLGWLGRIAALVIMAGVLGPAIWLLIEAVGTGPTWRVEGFLWYVVAMGAAVGCGGVLLVGARGAGSVTLERERDTWTSLLSTPLEAHEIITAKLLGNLYAARWMWGLMALLWILACLLKPGFMVAIPFIALPLGIVSLYASALGLLFSLFSKNTLRSMAGTLSLLIFLGGGYLFCCVPLMISGPGDEAMALIMAPLVPFLLAFAGIVNLEGFPSSEHEIVAAFGIGNVGYLILACLLLAWATGYFDHLAGRATGRMTGDMANSGQRPGTNPFDNQPP